MYQNGAGDPIRGTLATKALKQITRFDKGHCLCRRAICQSRDRHLRAHTIICFPALTLTITVLSDSL
jgi:hypothetical protein